MDTSPESPPPPSGPQSPKDRLRFPAWRHLRSSRDFHEIYGLKQKAADRRLLVFARKNDLGFTRIGLSVSRKHGNAVARHRLRRLLKEAYRLSQHDVPEGLDLILVPLPSDSHDVKQFQTSLVRLTKRLQRRLSTG